MIVYTTHCLACHRKALWKQLRDYAQRIRQPLEVRNTAYNTTWREEAKEYALHLPFVVIDGVAKSPEDLA